MCDSAIEVDALRCTECNTDLSLFDVDADGIPDAGSVPAANGKSIDDILASIMAGKDTQSDIFDDIKTIGTNGPIVEDNDILGETEVAPGVEFECPNCGTRVGASAKVCPGCGALFADEAVEQFECPLCGAVVDMDASSCPNCGVKFVEESPEEELSAATSPVPEPAPVVTTPAAPVAAVTTVTEPAPEPEPVAPARPGEKSPMERLWSVVEARKIPPEAEGLDRGELYKALPRLVNEVKPLLLTAKRVGVDIAGEKELISQAIAHGKKRDVEQAVRLIRDARYRLEVSFSTEIAKRIESVLVDAERARATGGDVGAVLSLSKAAIDALEEGDYGIASDKVSAAREEFEARSGGYANARQEYEAVQALFADARKVGFDLRDADAFLARSEAAMRGKNWDQAAGLAVQARQSLLKSLPVALSEEMKRARTALLEMKVRGGDLTKPVGILKQASIHIKREEYADAVRFVRMFHDEVGKIKT